MKHRYKKIYRLQLHCKFATIGNKQTSDCSREWIAEQFGVLLLANVWVLVTPVENGHGALGSHYSHFSCWPGVVQVTAQMLGRHHIVRSTVCLK